MPAVALTDHGTMFGAVHFYNAAKKEGIKPLIGMEAYLSPRSMHDRDHQLDSRTAHLLLLAENTQGYKNLLKIATAAQLEGFYYRPRIDSEFLAAHSDGLIATTGCMSGEVPRALAQGRQQFAEERLEDGDGVAARVGDGDGELDPAPDLVVAQIEEPLQIARAVGGVAGL